MKTCIGLFLLACGLLFLISAAVSLFRFRTALNRMHGAALGDSLGLLLTLAGAVLLSPVTVSLPKLLLILFFFFLTSPVATHLIAKTEIEYHGELHRANREYKEEDRT